MELNKPSLNQVSSLVQILGDNESIQRAYQTDKLREHLGNISLGQYKRFLALLFNSKIFELKRMLDQFKIPHKDHL